MFEILIAAIISFLTVFLLGPRYIRFIKNCGIVGIDVHKKEKPKVAELGGPLVAAGIISGIFIYIWVETFLNSNSKILVNLFAGLSTILIITLVGIFDDVSVLMKREKGKRIGLRKWQKPLLTLPAAIPLMAVMAGVHYMSFPIFGNVNLGLIYPLLLIPIGVVGAANGINLLGGFNGLETGTGAVLLSFLSFYAYLNGSITAAIIGIVTVAALLAFLIYNWYPAKIFPGDSLTYLIGSVVAVIAILGNIEKFSVLCFMPWFLELFLKVRSKLKAENFGILQKDGTLRAPYKKCYSLTHCVMKLGKFKEWEVSLLLILIVIFWCSFIFTIL